ncbi:MAG: GlcNAc-PI de-N-acetylase [Anaerolineae bacterium CG_4_9_14_3_um_filter_57_17]|nr:PIG-L family deacetylase [bacterium]NCT21112.1 PIG-L family deacetylase [bacterium]OIO83350.1 MAG: hypothetical protein AUK01_13005 [Anaerolineae bacterium CG2_30_57_67]PJB64534.1 MAG: GlcNAc-PI de-N-acetylase [Anaerolineae bacterium CG_4_9_14_3_um_filter_57_17]
MTKTLLAVLAHPDDESFGMGGTLALYASRGYDVYLVCATRGEVGTVDAHFLEGFNSIGELRESELRCAAHHLGLKEVFFLDYHDSGMTVSNDPQAQINAPLDEVAGRVLKIMRQVQPQVVLTFDPIGGYRHPDHIHIHKATVMAVEQAVQEGVGPARLYFHTIPRGFLRFGVRLIRLFGGNPAKWGRNKDIDLASLANVEFPTHARVDYTAVSERKTLASVCHASQGGSQMRSGLIGWLFRLFGEADTFMQAYPPVTGNPPVCRDLFEEV